MRNWNIGVRTEETAEWNCFYSTYEELKHEEGVIIGIENPSFYSTYEELKQHILKHGNIILFSFYSTYEELKLDEVYASYKCSEVFTVPMRNWNPRIEVFHKSMN